MNFVFVGIVNPSWGYYLLRELNHTCGPFLGDYGAIAPIYNESSLISNTLDVITFPPILIAIMFFFLGLALLNYNKGMVIEKFIESKEREYQLLVFDLQKRIETLKKRQKYLMNGPKEGLRPKSRATSRMMGNNN